MNIAVAGCGIAGTAVGYLLAKSGHDVTILEQADRCEPIGAGILLQPSGQAVLEQFGIKDAVADLSSPVYGLEARLASGKPLIHLEYDVLDPDSYAWGVHRGLLFDRLLKLCQSTGARIRTSSRVIDYAREAERISVVMESGERVAGFDFLIATDGSRSQLREPARIRCRTVEYPYAALWAIGPCDAVTDRLYQVIDGTDRLVGLLPIGSGRCSFFWGLRAEDYQTLSSGDIDRWKAQVVEFCPQAESVLETIVSFQQLTFATYRHVRMQRWHADGIIFLGDAAHPSSPHLGQGVNLALEDASCFAAALAETDTFDAACRKFETQRRSKLRYYQQLTNLLTPFFQSGSSLLGVGRNIALPWFPRVPWIYRQMLRTLCGTKNGWLK